MLSAQELQDMQNTLEDSLSSTCVIQRQNNTTDNYGGYTEGWANFAVNVPCRVSPAPADRGYNVLVAGAPKSVGEWLITLPPDTNVTVDDRIIWNSRYFQVRVVIDRTDEIALRLYASETK